VAPLGAQELPAHGDVRTLWLFWRRETLIHVYRGWHVGPRRGTTRCLTSLRVIEHGGNPANLPYLPHPRGTDRRAAVATRKPPRATSRRGLRNPERETGIEPATLSFGRRKGRQK
jgi:hypothetical protein